MSAAPTSLPAGDWGGEQVMLTVGSDKALLRLGCAEGEFAMPVKLDSQGRFSQLGMITEQSGGPSTGTERPVRVTFEGKLAGSGLALVVRKGTTAETYQLYQGARSKVIRCL